MTAKYEKPTNQSPDSFYLYTAISYFQRLVALQVVKTVKCYLEHYKNLIMSGKSYRIPVSNSVDYENVMSLDR